MSVPNPIRWYNVSWTPVTLLSPSLSPSTSLRYTTGHRLRVMTTPTWWDAPTPNLIYATTVLEKRFFIRCNPTRQPPTKKTLAIAPQHRPSRSIIYFPTLTPTSRVVETSRIGLEPILSVLETDVLPLTLPTLKYAILTRRSRASNRKLEPNECERESTRLNSSYLFSDAKEKRLWFTQNCESGTRTHDLRLMRPTIWPLIYLALKSSQMWAYILMICNNWTIRDVTMKWAKTESTQFLSHSTLENIVWNTVLLQLY